MGESVFANFSSLKQLKMKMFPFVGYNARLVDINCLHFQLISAYGNKIGSFLLPFPMLTQVHVYYAKVTLVICAVICFVI